MRTQRTRIIFFGALVAASASAGLLSVGCSGGSTLKGADAVDKQRDGALAVFVNRKVTDSVDAAEGDTTDWKYVDIPDNGQMTVAVAFDNPGSVKGHVVLRDNFASVIERHELTPDRSVYAFNPIQARKSRYYIEILAESGGSVYTVGVNLEQVNLAGFGQGGDNFDREGLEDSGGRKVGTGNRRRRRTRPDKDDSGSTQETVEAEVEEEEEEDDPQTLLVSGYIVRVIPRDDGGTIVHMNLSGEGTELVGKGTRGKIAKIGQAVVVSQRRGSFAIGFTKADSEDCKTHKNVTFAVKR